MERFLVFYGDTYYPSGGWNDFYASYPTKETALAASESLVSSRTADWSQVVDGQTGERLTYADEELA